MNIRGRLIKVQAKEGRQRAFVEHQLAQRTNEQLDQYEAESYPDRAIVRRALRKVSEAEEQLRFLMMDKLEEAERELADDPDAIPDYVNEDGEGMLYPENVDSQLDGIVGLTFELYIHLSEYLEDMK